MRIILFLAITVLILPGCRSTETAPDPLFVVPQSIRDVVYQSYPSAGELLAVSELEKDRVYELAFKLGQADYTAIVSKSGILRVARTAGEPVPDSLASKIQSLTIKGGELSNYRTISFADGRTVPAADYLLNGVKYVIQFGQWNISLYTFEKDFEMRNMRDLPDAIQQYITQRHRPDSLFVNSLTNLNEQSRQYIIKNNELTFTTCWVQVMPDGAKRYQVYVNYFGTTSLPIMFNENGEVIWTGFFNRLRKFEQDFNGTPAFWLPNLTSQEITYFRDLLAGSSHLFGFNFDNFINFDRSYRNEYEDHMGYQLELSNIRNEHWYLFYNGDKKMVYSAYSSN